MGVRSGDTLRHIVGMFNQKEQTMSFNELTEEQKLELKQNFLTKDHDVSYGELADADELVSDEELEAEYGHVEFSNDDFCCTAGR